MKKALLALILGAVAIVSFGVMSYAIADDTGNLVVHFQAWDGDYENLGSHAWGGPAAGKLADGTDAFGAYWEYNDIPVGTSVGFIAVYWVGEGPDWNAKLTGDIFIDESAVVAGETTHVYVFEGAATTDDDPGHYIASHDYANMLVVYYDPSNSYEENLGVHAWGWNDVPSEWGNPYQGFTKAGASEAGYDVKGMMLQATDDWAGLLVYAGSDANKKTGDVTLAGATTFEPGNVGIAYVVSKGDAYTANDNVFYNDAASFAELAFSFTLVPYDNEEKTGTYAVNPSTVIVITGSQVESPYLDAEDKEAATATIEGWFEIREDLGEGVYGDPIAIERVDFATTNTTLNAFVLVIEEGSELDNTLAYEVFFNDGTNEASLPVDVDSEAPVLTFINPSSIVGQLPEDRIITIEWGQPFDPNFFPRFLVDDNRDGDLTPFVYVPEGEFSTLDTREEGDYTIMLRVEDEWGNVTEETFIFRVAKSN
jgi:hypothetical protein